MTVAGQMLSRLWRVVADLSGDFGVLESVEWRLQLRGQGLVPLVRKDEDLGPLAGDDHLGPDVDAQLAKLILDALTWKQRVEGSNDGISSLWVNLRISSLNWSIILRTILLKNLGLIFNAIFVGPPRSTSTWHFCLRVANLVTTLRGSIAAHLLPPLVFRLLINRDQRSQQNTKWNSSITSYQHQHNTEEHHWVPTAE